MNQPLLFNSRSFLTEASGIVSRVRRAVELLTTSNSLITTEPEAIITSLYNANQVGTIAIDLENITQTAPQEVQVDVFDETAANGLRLTEGTRFVFRIPFTGNATLLQLSLLTTEQATVGKVEEDGAISFFLEQATTGNIEDLITAYQTNTGNISSNATALNGEVATFNTTLHQHITDLVTARKARLDKLQNDAAAFGVPIAP